MAPAASSPPASIGMRYRHIITGQTCVVKDVTSTRITIVVEGQREWLVPHDFTAVWRVKSCAK